MRVAAWLYAMVVCTRVTLEAWQDTESDRVTVWLVRVILTGLLLAIAVLL